MTIISKAALPEGSPLQILLFLHPGFIENKTGKHCSIFPIRRLFFIDFIYLTASLFLDY